jgi:serine/threonine-protein kinase
MVHRDLKPGNLFAAEVGGVCDFAKVIDFGLVFDAGDSVEPYSREALVVGSPNFAAPEMTLGEHAVGPRTDIYSLGATAYYLLTGRPVFERTAPMQVLLAHVRDTPIPPSQLAAGVSSELEAIVLKCLAKAPEDRFATVEELAAALATLREADAWTGTDARQWWAQFGEAANGDSATFDGEATTLLRCRAA